MRMLRIVAVALSVSVLVGCGPVKVDFSTIEKPARAPELDAYDHFVGTWAFEADQTVPDGEPVKWTGTTTWDWAMNKTFLEGSMELTGPKTFAAKGHWGWHPTKKTYMWGLMNDWGYPQMGTATYNEACKCWCMKYYGVGMDGTDSYGQYCIKIVDDNNMEWCMNEWADSLHMVKKLEMKGTYKRK